MKWYRKYFIILLSISFFSGTCIAKEDSTKYLQDTIPSTWEAPELQYNDQAVEDSWWNSFNDSCLDSLISMGLTNNYDVLMALKRVQIAKAAIKTAESGYYPKVGLDANWTKNRTSGNIYNPALDNSTVDYFSLGANLSWQMDIFGQITKGVQEQKANWRASRAQFDGVMTTLCANIALSYINLRMMQKEYEVAQYHIKSQKLVVDLTEARYKSGLSSLLDVNQAKTVYYSTLSTLPTLYASIETQINSLATLVGVYPQQIKEWLVAQRPMPDYHQIVSVSVPMDLLRRRPDIRQAEQQIQAYSAALGIAKKDYLPMLTLQGSVGFDSHSLDNMFKKGSLAYSIQPTLSWTVFDGLAREAGVVSAKEQLQLGIDNYNFTVMTAYQDVSNSMINYNYSLNSIVALDAVMKEAQSTLTLSIELYKRGLSAFTNVVNAQLTFLQYNNSLVQAQGKALNSLVSLYEALGGGWETNQIANNK